MGRIALGILIKGVSTGTISLGLAYFNCTTWVIYWPMSGRCAALLVSKRAPAVLPCASGIALTNLSPMLTMVMPLSKDRCGDDFRGEPLYWHVNLSHHPR